MFWSNIWPILKNILCLRRTCILLWEDCSIDVCFRSTWSIVWLKSNISLLIFIWIIDPLLKIKYWSIPLLFIVYFSLPICQYLLNIFRCSDVELFIYIYDCYLSDHYIMTFFAFHYHICLNILFCWHMYSYPYYLLVSIVWSIFFSSFTFNLCVFFSWAEFLVEYIYIVESCFFPAIVFSLENSIHLHLR